MNRLYTEKDLKNAAKVGKAFVSFQYIAGRGAINECWGDCNTIMSYCVDMFAGLLCRTPLTMPIEDVMEDVKKKIIERYTLHHDAIDNGNVKFSTM